jgi:LysM repeat protein
MKVTILEKNLSNVFYHVYKGDNLESIAKKLNTTINIIKQSNPLSDLDNLEEGDILFISKCFKYVYITKPLDSLESIAKNFNVSVQYIKEVNNIENIFVGERILI